MWREVVNRELGISRPSCFANRTRASRLATLKLSNTKEIISPHKGAVNTLQVDLTEGRYLLSGASDGSAAVFDIQQATSHDGGHVVSKHRSLFVVDKQLQHGHSYAISSACWYPIDTGLFVTGSYDNYVKVWDTNTTQVELSFKMPGRVYGIAMSSASTSHMLIAAGTEDVQVRLCDIATGAFTHTLSGHRDGVMAVQWSTSSDWVLITGGCDGAIRFWDIRRAGCFRVLDQLDTQIGRRKPLLGDKSSKPSAPQSSGSSCITSLMEQLEQKRAAVGYGAKQSNIVLKGKGQGSLVQRLHPGVSSVHNRATAHYGAVTGLKIADDGMYLVSAGTDSRLRLWDIESGCNTLVNYDALRLHQKKPLQMAVSSETVFVPSSTSIKAYDMWSGKNSSIFKGHYEPVNCCSFSASDQELFTGGNDRQILIWSPAVPELIEEDDAVIKGSKCQPDKDAWSD